MNKIYASNSEVGGDEVNVNTKIIDFGIAFASNTNCNRKLTHLDIFERSLSEKVDEHGQNGHHDEQENSKRSLGKRPVSEQTARAMSVSE